MLKVVRICLQMYLFQKSSQLIQLLYLDFVVSINYFILLDRPFIYCSALKNISVKPGSIHTDFDISSTSVLTSESIESIIGGLADGESHTLKLNTESEHYSNSIGCRFRKRLDVIWRSRSIGGFK